jgi:hypothetical protein
MSKGDVIYTNDDANCRNALHRIRIGGGYSFYNGFWVHYSREDMQLIATDALLGKVARDGRDIQRARKYGTEQDEIEAGAQPIGGLEEVKE